MMIFITADCMNRLHDFPMYTTINHSCLHSHVNNIKIPRSAMTPYQDSIMTHYHLDHCVSLLWAEARSVDVGNLDI